MASATRALRTAALAERAASGSGGNDSGRAGAERATAAQRLQRCRLAQRTSEHGARGDERLRRRLVSSAHRWRGDTSLDNPGAPKRRAPQMGQGRRGLRGSGMSAIGCDAATSRQPRNSQPTTRAIGARTRLSSHASPSVRLAPGITSLYSERPIVTTPSAPMRYPRPGGDHRGAACFARERPRTSSCASLRPPRLTRAPSETRTQEAWRASHCERPRTRSCARSATVLS